MRFSVLTTAVIALLFCGAAHAVEDCELNGQHANPANGSTYAGKSGIMKCVDRETRKLKRETEYRDGKAIGYRKSVDLSGNVTIGNYNEQGNRDGEFKQFAADGTLISEERYSNGSTDGVQTHFHKNKQVRRKSFSEPRKGSLASIEYNDRGQVTQLRCAEKPLLGDDRALCGFDGRISEVTLHNAKGDVAGQVRYQNGKPLTATALNAQGIVARSEEVKGDRRVARENFPDGSPRLETVFVANRKDSERELARGGQPVRETRWRDGWMSEETLWYLNGQLKSKTQYEREGNQVLVKAEEFWDNGKTRSRSVRDERRGYVGVVQRFNDAGALESEATYEQGKVARRKTYKDGRLVLDEEYFEDGSRKSTRKAE